jgi:hypothetical protein
VTEPKILPLFWRTADALRSRALAYASGKITQEQFVSALLTLDEDKFKPYGMTLSVTHTSDNWLSVLLKHAPTGKLWAAFEFLPEDPQFRPFSNLAQYPEWLRPKVGTSRSGGRNQQLTSRAN